MRMARATRAPPIQNVLRERLTFSSPSQRNTKQSAEQFPWWPSCDWDAHKTLTPTMKRFFIHDRLESGTLGRWDASKGGPCVDPVDHPDCGSRIGSTRFSRVPIDAQMRGRSASRPSEAC